MASAAALALLLCCALCAASPAQQRGRLLRVPKVYNALITSNEPLLPSRTEQATVGQVLYYPPHHATYPASSGPLILPQVAAQAPPLYDPSQAAVPGAPPQPLESLPAAPGVGGAGGPPLELSLHEPGATQHAPGAHEPAPQQQVTPWPVVYASDVQQQQQQQQLYAPEVQQQQQQLYAGAGQPEHAVQEPLGQPGAQEDQPPQQQQQQQQQLPLAHAVQTVERVEQPGQYQPPAAVDIDAVKNNRPQGIPDVPPPPLPVGRGRKAQHQQPPPPGLLPF